jgi:hypothetical protein
MFQHFNWVRSNCVIFFMLFKNFVASVYTMLICAIFLWWKAVIFFYVLFLDMMSFPASNYCWRDSIIIVCLFFNVQVYFNYKSSVGYSLEGLGYFIQSIYIYWQNHKELKLRFKIWKIKIKPGKVYIHPR